MKKLLFVIESLNLGGAEKSLVTLLNLIDYDQYDVDLQLFSYGGDFEQLLPKKVNLLPIIPFFEYCNIPYKNYKNKLAHPKYLISQLSYSLNLRVKKYNNIEKSVIMWKKVHKSFKKQSNEYDVAIAYAQGVPTFYVADKIIAKKKMAWVNVSYFPQAKYKRYINKYFNRFDKVNCVSESVKNQIISHFNIDVKKLVVIKDIVSYDINYKLSMLEDLYLPKNEGYVLLTVGRIVYQKGYDIAVGACKILKERGLPFKWYVVGDGNLAGEIKNKVRENGLENSFILVGAKSNPYPYFKACEIYVQCSRFEGFGIVLTEARQFNKPIVTTNFDSVKNQITNNINGLIVSMNPISVANGIEKMMKDKDYRNRIIKNIEKEKKENIEELEKFYEVVEKL